MGLTGGATLRLSYMSYMKRLSPAILNTERAPVSVRGREDERGGESGKGEEGV